jgi:hypothetical protein
VRLTYSIFMDKIHFLWDLHRSALSRCLRGKHRAIAPLKVVASVTPLAKSASAAPLAPALQYRGSRPSLRFARFTRNIISIIRGIVVMVKVLSRHCDQKERGEPLRCAAFVTVLAKRRNHRAKPLLAPPRLSLYDGLAGESSW